MEFKVYKLSYYLNTQHSMDYHKDQAHAHTFTITLYIEDLSRKEFLDFISLNNIVNNYLKQFTGQYLNNMKEFKDLSPTIENMGSVFYEYLKMILKDEYDLIQLDIYENPLRIYSISDRLYLGVKPPEAI